MGRIPRGAVAAALILSACSSTTPAPQTQPPGSHHPEATTSATRSAPPKQPEWPSYHGTGDRAGAADIDPLRPPLTIAWRHHLDGQLYAQPIVAAGNVIAATENDTLWALNPSSGAVRWSRHLAAPIRQSALPCGNIDPSGITGTPAYDDRTGLVFAVTESTRARHVLWAVDARTGQVRWRRSVDVARGRDPIAEQERGAVLVTSGRVVVAFGGRSGDCGNYVGYVVSVATDGTGAIHQYAVPTARRAGMWAAAGPVAGPGGDIYVASGNGAQTGGHYDGSDSVIRLSETLRRKGFFAPSTWALDNVKDLDLGSMSPAVVGNRIVIAGKRGVVFLLDPSLGGVGGEVTSITGCAGYGGAAVANGVVYLPCDAGVRALAVRGNASLHWLWGPIAGLRSPALARGVVYALDQDHGRLVELDLRTGKRRGDVPVGTVTRFATPAPVGRFVYVGTTSAVVAIAGRA